MASAPQFTLSPHHLNFGEVGPGSQPAPKKVIVTNQSGGGLNLDVQGIPPWVHVEFGAQSGNDVTLEIGLDPAQLGGSGTHRATLEVRGGQTTDRLHVTVRRTGAGQPPPTPSGSPTTSTAGPSPAGSGGSGSPTSAGGTGPASPTSAGPSAPSFPPVVVAPLGVSILLTAVLLGLLFTIVQSIVIAGMAGQPNAGPMSLILGAAAVTIYLLAVLARTVPARSRVLNPSSTNPVHRRVLDTLGWVCGQAGVPVPPVVLRPDPSPNVVGCGLSPRWCCLYVNQGLLSALEPPEDSGDPDPLAAPLAHEIAHLKRSDTLFFSCLAPMLAAVNWVLGLVRSFGSLPGKGIGGLGFLPVMLLMMLPRKGCGGGLGCLIGALAVMVALSVLAMMATVVLAYVAFGILALVLFAMICLAYCRYVEQQADREAAKMVENSDLVLRALVTTGDYWPTERALLDQFASLNLGTISDYDGYDLVRSLNAGADPASGIDAKRRLFRSHPLLVERMANLIRTFGTDIT